MNFLRYLFEQVPGKNFSFYPHFIVLIIILLISGIAFSIIYKKKKKEDPAFKKLFSKISTRLILFALLFIVLLLVRFENIPYFSMRIWLYLTVLIFIFLSYRTIRVYKVNYPKEKHNAEQVKTIKKENKYLPNKKKRK